MSKDVILIHGLYLNGLSMVYIGKYLQSKGISVYYFEYNSINYDEDIILNSLHSLVNMIKTKKPKSEISLLGFSMGGLIARNYVQTKDENQLITKIITVGTPHKSSTLAKQIQKTKMNFILGTSGNAGLVTQLTSFTKQIPFGCIAGDSVMGLGLNTALKFFNKPNRPNDGLVFVDEAIIDNATDSKIVKKSHKMMLFSNKINELCFNFIEKSKFS